MYQITLFKNRFDNQTDKFIRVETWDELVNLMYKLNEKVYKNKSDAPLISPASYIEGTTRANKNVIEWTSWFALDIDDLDCSNDEVQNVIHSRFGDWDYLCHSSGSCKEDKPKCRVIVRTTEPIRCDKIKHFWFGINCLVGNLGDGQTKDLSRMFYVPGKVDGSVNFLFNSNSGNGIDPNEIIKRYPYIPKTGNSFLDKLPEGIRNQVIEHRKSELTNTSVTWTSYRNCKYWPKKKALEYTLTSSGWYAMLNGIMVSLACNAVKDNYPITGKQIADMCYEFDRDNGNWYQKRPIILEANGAINYAYAKTMGYQIS